MIDTKETAALSHLSLLVLMRTESFGQVGVYL